MNAAATDKLLLSIVELGGYPNLAPVYTEAGYTVELVMSMRKAMSLLKKRTPAVIVAEYNFQRDFRDRTSNLETLFASLQRLPETRLIVFLEPQHKEKFDEVVDRFSVRDSLHAALLFPVDPVKVRQVLGELG